MLEFSNDSPIYLQIIEDFKNRIISKEYQPGDKIPSVRELAQYYGVNPNTVQKALMLMEYEHIVYAQRTSGRYIREDFDPSTLKNETVIEDFDQFIERQKNRGLGREEILETLKRRLQYAK